MRIILTHEQADFDAIASQLGAHILDESAIPVLPQRINRNGRAFLTIYGVELPFLERRDLPKEPIEVITLVDTQSMVSLKGTSEETRVHVIDHHDLRNDLPPEWNVTVEPTGASTTILVEAIRERQIPFTAIKATLLLLGIYEDTGSLTYSRTTPRDLHASAFLLEQGASLSVATDYLNHPLSMGQQELYDLLRENTETHQVHGHTIVVSSGDASEMNEELSTLAHKLRDLIDPEGLFLLVKIRGGVQLIARSASDEVNVAEIASHFGGGGHRRASAALIKNRPLDDIYSELINILPKHIRPAVTVDKIMSREPQLLTPETPVREIARRMQRYGYEGFPVVENGNVIGLVTRRAVDRAITHKLNLTARNLMEAGEVTIHPDDPIEDVQHLMTDSGWGQVPVVDPKSGYIVGIVTRTDLLKTLAPEPTIPGRLNLADRLEKALPPVHLQLLKVIAQIADKEHHALYIVGGFVRDLLLEHPSLDLDLVVEGDAILLTKALSAKYGGRVTAHARFGTAKWFIEDIKKEILKKISKDTKERDENPIWENENETIPPLPDTIDLVTARTEFYTHPTALPTVERGSIKLDLHRRDFTINTMALRLDGRHYGELHDYWGGYNDLHQELIRVLHSLSFVDDPTRMLRAVRFEQRFDFQIEKRTLELLRAALHPSTSSGQTLLERISGDRIRHELDYILDEPKAAQMLDRLQELDLLEAIHAELPWDGWLHMQIARTREAEPEPEWGLDENYKGIPLPRALAYNLWFIRTPAEKVINITHRLKFNSDLEEAILATCRLWQELAPLRNAPPSEVTRQLENHSPISLYAAYLATPDKTLRAVLYEYVSNWQHVKPTITGHDLRERGLPPGPIYREMLTKLREAWLDGDLSNPDEEEALFQQLLKGVN